MKWIVKRHFYRTEQMREGKRFGIEISGACKGAKEDAPHANHIHIGAIFDFGPWKNESELQLARKDDDKIFIAGLRYSGCIGDASDKEVVARVEADVAAENAERVRQEKANTAINSGKLLEVFTSLLEKATAPALAPAK